jgi:hypothetical protein
LSYFARASRGGNLHRVAVGTCLLGLALFMGRRLAMPSYWQSLGATSNPGFAFDPSYQGFLEAIAASTPATATVAVIAPPGELYVCQAAYQLAPRRVVFGGHEKEAGCVAIYLTTVVPPPPRSIPIRGGLLLCPD